MSDSKDWSEMDKAMLAAWNKKVQEREKPAAGGTTKGKAWTPPRCGRPGCHNAAAIDHKDWKAELAYVTPRGEEPRAFYCSKECFRIVRDGIHGAKGRYRGRSDASI